MIETIDGARIKILGDVHAGHAFLHNVPLNRRGDRERQVWAKLEIELEPEGADFHVSMGDTFDKAVVPYGVVYRTARLYAEAAIENPKTTFVILRGNHDASRDLEDISAFDLFSMILAGAANILVVRKPLQRDALLFVPWHPTKSAEEMARGICGSTAFGHWMSISDPTRSISFRQSSSPSRDLGRPTPDTFTRPTSSSVTASTSMSPEACCPMRMVRIQRARST